MIEHYFSCPHCWETISMLLDPSASTAYIEDCEVCCNPIEIQVNFQAGTLVDFSANPIGQ